MLNYMLGKGETQDLSVKRGVVHGGCRELTRNSGF